jgi:hypothetical protein
MTLFGTERISWAYTHIYFRQVYTQTLTLSANPFLDASAIGIAEAYSSVSIGISSAFGGILRLMPMHPIQFRACHGRKSLQ